VQLVEQGLPVVGLPCVFRSASRGLPLPVSIDDEKTQFYKDPQPYTDEAKPTEKVIYYRPVYSRVFERVVISTSGYDEVQRVRQSPPPPAMAILR